jgi:hypothetical protein
MNYGIMIAVGLVLICFIAMLVSHSVAKEGFDVSQYVTRANDNDPMFSQTIPNGVYTNKGLSLNTTELNKALDQPDLYQTQSPSTDYSPLFQEDPEGLFQAQDEQFCQGATHPRNLPNRGLARVGCGWVYRADPSRPSKGAIGTSKGPIFSAGNEGQWIWNLKVAAQMEDIKQCKKLTSCGNVDGNDFSGICGFCPDSGHGVPINSQGAQLYPDDVTGGACASVPARTASQCVVPTTDTGDSLPVGGGSTSGSNDPNVCAVSSTGTIFAACVIRQALQAGMSAGGAFILNINNPTQTMSETDKEAYAILRQAGYLLPTSPFRVDPITALNQCSAVVKAQVSGSNSQIRGAAALLSAGTAFNLCDIDPSVMGPFKPACVQQEFRKAGCQPGGAQFPATADKASAASLGLNIEGVRAKFNQLFASMSSSNGTVADKAVQDCLGIKVSRPAGSPCDSAWIKNAASTSEGFRVEEGFASQQQAFLLQSHNYPNYLMRSMGAGAQGEIVVGKGTGSVFVLVAGSAPGTVQIQPQALPGTSLSPVASEAVNTMSEAPSVTNSYRVVPGLADPNKVSFQSAADPTRYIRHAGFKLFAHRNDGGSLFAADATFQSLDVNARAIQLQLPAVSMYGWKGISMAKTVRTISVGADNAIWYSANDGSTGLVNGVTTSTDVTPPAKIMVDCASATSAVSVGNDGVLYYRDANRRWAPIKTVGPAVLVASIAGDGSIGYVNTSREIYRGRPGAFTKMPGSAYFISLGKTGNDVYVVGTDRTLYIWREGRNMGNDSWENIPNPPGILFNQITVSKDGFKVAGVSLTAKLYGLDVFNKWSEIPNPVGIGYIGLNKNQMVGSTGQYAYTKSIAIKEGFTSSQNPSGYIKSLGKYPESDIQLGCFSNKGIEETKRVCNQNPDCAGFSYAKTGSDGCFKKGPLTPDLRINAAYDGFTKDPMPKFTPRASLPTTVTPRQGVVIGNIKVAENYRLSFNITPKGLVGNWSSILHFNGTGRDCCGAGDRSPAIFFFPGGLTLHVRIGDMTNGNWGVDINGCTIGRTSKVVLECRNSVVKVMVDSSSSTLIQPSKRASGPANVYCGDPWYPPANAQIENLMYEYL